MENKIIGILLVLALIAGVVFVTAIGNSSPSAVEVEDQPKSCGIPQTCGPETCANECGGNCGIPTCGCSR